jgi:hypothetical protein
MSKVRMERKATSRTEKESFAVERFFADLHYKTTITNGKEEVEGRGKTANEVESRAIKKWGEK